MDTNEEAREQSFPAKTRQALGTINGVATEANSVWFSDRIMVTMSQEGRLSQWVHVPILPSPADMVDMNLSASSRGMLPSTHLTATTLLGGGGDERETLGQFYAAQIARLISLRDSEDRRTLVLGLGLLKVDTAREAFFDTMDLIKEVL
ncbi:hypothetical protein HYQ45_013918 [Verticillium longisporum]|uniref:Proteasome assembly chaperone 3 n=1 Tax=Verticillium longisporum TaxID=100787 RepID=A0A8I2Z9W2_VERLO|nr:hypothetical protein HYQ45_013918 [Verticillium longisporum]